MHTSEGLADLVSLSQFGEGAACGLVFLTFGVL
jgi:hypothetical protein